MNRFEWKGFYIPDMKADGFQLFYRDEDGDTTDIAQLIPIQSGCWILNNVRDEAIKRRIDKWNIIAEDINEAKDTAEREIHNAIKKILRYYGTLAEAFKNN